MTEKEKAFWLDYAVRTLLFDGYLIIYRDPGRSWMAGAITAHRKFADIEKPEYWPEDTDRATIHVEDGKVTEFWINGEKEKV